MDMCKVCAKEIPLNHVQVGGVHMNCEHAYMTEKSELMVKMRPFDHSPWLIVPMKELTDVLDSDDECNEYVVQKVLMTKFEVNSLAVFTGW